MFALAFQKTFWPFFVVMLIYQLAYMPTMSLTNAICFHHISNAQTEFGKLRLWGTIGWIAASWPFVFILAGKTGPELHAALSSIFTVAGIASIALAAFSLTLPHTPPAQARRRRERADEGDRAAARSGDARAVHRDDDGCARAPVLLPVDQSVPAAGGACRELDHAGDERRPDRGDRVDGRARLGTGAAGMAMDDDRRHPRACRPLLRVRDWRSAVADGRDQRRPRHVLRVLLRGGLHLRRRALPARCARERAGLVQPGDSRFGPFAGSLLWGWLGDVFRTPRMARSISRASSSRPRPSRSPRRC